MASASSEVRYTTSGIPIRTVYKQADIDDIDDIDYDRDLGDPGQYPFVRGLYPTGYRGATWQTCPACSYGLPEDSNKRIRFLANAGATGFKGRISVNWGPHIPGQHGYDSDHPLAKYELGEAGSVMDSVKDMELLFDGLPIDDMHISVVHQIAGSIILALLIAYAENRGVPRAKLMGTMTNFGLALAPVWKWESMLPPAAMLRVTVDGVKFCTREMPDWNPVNVLSYCFRNAGSTAVQEVAFGIAAARELVKACIEAGMEVDDFASRIIFFFAIDNNFFEEIAKFRAARKVWAKLMREEFGAQNERTCRLKIYAQNNGATLTAQEPLNNISRIAIQLLAGVLGGCQSIAPDSYDEGIGIPTEDAARIAVKTEKIIEHETGVVDVVDPLGGSYYIESLTRELERAIWHELDKIEAVGGAFVCIENGYFEREINKASLKYQNEIDNGERIVVGLNKYVEEEMVTPPKAFKIDAKTREIALERLRKMKEERDNEKVKQALAKIREAASTEEGELMPVFIEAAKANATVGEMYGVLKDVFGVWRPQSSLAAG